MRKTFWLFWVSFAMLPALAAGPQADYNGKTVLNGAYTADQAARGLAAYTARCARCHGEDLSAATPLNDQKFIDRWREEKLDFVFGVIKTTMPRGNGGSLPDAQYIDILTYILQQNGYPAGSEELTLANMPTIQFVGENGPSAAPNLTIVQAVGCLTTTPAGIWNLTNGTEPVRVRRADEVTADDLKAVEAVALGSHTFRLNLDNLATPYDPAPHAGHKMFVKGVLNRQTTGERVNVTAIGMLAATCAP